MSYHVLIIAHVTGLALTFMGLAGVLGMKMSSQTRPKQRWVFSAAHGVGLLLLLVSGFMLVAKSGLMGGGHFLPGWVLAKLGIWMLAGGATVLASRLSRYAAFVLLIFAVLVAAATWLAIAKPF
jgi:hypothetical protein